jgi:aspartyl-tRNA(Asn)/glutamyl-tRNA(Gln) amidotransferase subunit A
VRDAALLLGAMTGPDARDPLSIDTLPEDYVAACEGDLKGLEVVWSGDLGYAPVEPEVRRIAEAAALRLADAGARVEARDPGWPDPGAFHRILCDVSNATRHFDRALRRPGWIEPSLMQMIEDGRRVSGVEYGRANLQRSAFYDRVHRFFETCDLLVTPQQPVGAWLADPGPGAHQGPTVIGGRATPSIFDRLGFTFPFNLTGHPAISVPCGLTGEGLPVGLQIVGKWHADRLVLRAAAVLEALQPWASRRPEID